MSIALALLGRAWPFLLAAILAATAAGWVMHKADSIGYNRLQNEYSGYRLKVADQDVAAEKAAREALQAQIEQGHAVARNNQEVMDALAKRTTEAESHYSADRALIRGLLNAASTNPAAHSHPLREGESGPSAAPAGAADGVEQVAELCAATKAEDELNANRLDALIAEVNPQL